MRAVFFISCGLFLLVACERAQEHALPVEETAVGEIRILEDEFQGAPIVLAGSATQDFAVAFERVLDGTLLKFHVQQRSLPLLMSDQEGNVWDIFGAAVEGPRKGQRLKPLKATRGYWFAFGGMFPGVEIHGRPSAPVQLSPPQTSPLWLVDTRYLVAGAFFDQISTIDDPKTIQYDFRQHGGDHFYVKDDDIVILVRLGTQVRAYPKKLLDWHEIINDTLDGKPIAVTYHPLSGTVMVWERKLLNYFDTKLGISGLMYNINLVAFDRATTSYWSQLLGKCIGGPLGGVEPVVIPAVELSWLQWRRMTPKPFVISDQTGFARNYQINPYPNFPSREEFPAYPIAYQDMRLPLKERVFGVIIGEQARVYRMTSFK